MENQTMIAFRTNMKFIRVPNHHWPQVGVLRPMLGPADGRGNEPGGEFIFTFIAEDRRGRARSVRVVG